MAASGFEMTGTVITITSFAAKITSVSWSQSREQIEVSHFGSTTWREYIPSALQDPGELTIGMNFDPALDPPLGDAAGTITVAFSDSASTTWTFTGFMTNFEFSGEVGSVATATATIKATGAIS